MLSPEQRDLLARYFGDSVTRHISGDLLVPEAGLVALLARQERVAVAMRNLLAYAEGAADKIEYEWGSCRSLAELEARGALAPEIVAARTALAAQPNAAGG